MNAKHEIADQVRDLLAYFPGRGRLPLLWLVLIPVIEIFYLRIVLHNYAGPVPSAVYVASGTSVRWFYFATMFALLLRMNHSGQSSWLASTKIIASSVVYGCILGLPSLLVMAAWAVCYVGVSFLSLLVILLGALAVVGAVFLLAIVLGAIAHRAGFFIALLIFLVSTVYVLFLPTAFSVTLVPEHWRWLHAAMPLSPAIAVLRMGVLNLSSGTVPAIYSVDAAIHAVLGFALACWIWRAISIPSLSDSTLIK